jgi:predicted glutamine amidotransferase
MCIIAAKPSGVAMPTRDTIRNMWNVNSDGAGIMYVENNKVRIEKGFMKYKSFAKKLDELERRLDLTATPLVMHFRITTHGGTKPENTHPFPITDSIGALKKLKSYADVGVAHNGIITSVSPRKGISDTMEYIATQLAPLKRALPRFYTNKDAMLLVKNAIESKMAFLTKEGKIYTIGDFIEDKGVLYSNGSYQKSYYHYRNLGGWNCYADWDKYLDEAPWSTDAVDAGDCEVLQWLDEGEFVRLSGGGLMENEDFLIDECNGVWRYDYQKDAAIRVSGAMAYTANGTPKQYDYDSDSTELVPVVYGTTVEM